MTTDRFKKHIIGLVSRNDLLLSLFSQPDFVGVNGEMACKLGISLERDGIRKMVIEETNNEKEELQRTLKGRFVFLKMDACTRHRVNYFASNVRFVDGNNKIVTQTLAVKDTEAHYTSEYLEKLVEKVLKDFEINDEQVLCVITDNA
jgi:hypothetical protein